MAERFSPQWIAELDERLAAAPLDDEPAALDGLVVQVVVADRAAWTLGVEDGRLRARPGHDAAATATLTVTEAVAEAIAAGRVSAQAAFMAGDLRIGGDAAALLALGPSLPYLL